MNNQAGKIIMSTNAMEDPNFQHSVVFIAQHDENGALGFVINKVFDRALNDLEEFKHIPAFPLYDGGPVDREHLYFVHRRGDLIPNGTLISNGIFLGGDFSQAVSQINSGHLGPADIKIFIGYCGWDSHELESEIAEGSWTIKDESSERVFESGAR